MCEDTMSINAVIVTRNLFEHLLLILIGYENGHSKYNLKCICLNIKQNKCFNFLKIETIIVMTVTNDLAVSISQTNIVHS